MVDLNKGLSKTLKRYSFFTDMSKKPRKAIAGCAKNEMIEAGQYLFRSGDAADKFYLVRDGGIAVEMHVPGQEPMVMGTYYRGEVLGWSWLIKPYLRSYDARALEDTRVISFDGRCLRGKLDKDHTLAYDLFKKFVPIMGEQLQEARLQLLDLYGTPSKRIKAEEKE